MHSGLGSNSCGEEQTYENKTRLNDYRMRLAFAFYNGQMETVAESCCNALRGVPENE